jgi:hypothetical protein
MMNERIKDLWQLAACYVNPLKTGGEWQAEFVEKFAELIIRECLGDLKERIALRYQGSDKDCDIGYGMEIVYYDIIDRFGVES